MKSRASTRPHRKSIEASFAFSRLYVTLTRARDNSTLRRNEKDCLLERPYNWDGVKRNRPSGTVLLRL